MRSIQAGPDRTPHDATLIVDGLAFRDLDHDGALAPYEDWRLPDEVRVDDLLSRMTPAELIGTLLHGTAAATGSPLGRLGVGSGYDLEVLADAIQHNGVTSMISRLGLPARELAEQSNALQTLAASGRLGIPVTLSTDPRHHANAVLGAGVGARTFSVWPDVLGLGAIGDPDLVRTFGEAIRAEYRAVGFHMALSPQADLATSPRWPRIEGTFGEDPDAVRKLVGAYVEGAQGGAEGLQPDGVACIVKHWVGYGASRDGFDGHSYYGRYSAFPSGSFAAHVDAFRDAFAARVAGVMPTYNILDGLTLDGEPVEAVGAGFAEQIVDGLLRTTHGYQGLVVSDWAIMRTLTESGRTGQPPQEPHEIAMPWGVDHLSDVERFAKGLNAGLDQFGGEDDPAPLLEALRSGLIDLDRVRAAARRVLSLKFHQGLFDNPFVDPSAAATIVGQSDFVDAGLRAQARSLTALVAPDAVAITPGARVFVDGLDASAFRSFGACVVDRLDDATIAVAMVHAPFETLHPTFFFGARQHEGSLAFADDDRQLARVRELASVVPTVVVIRLDRPAVIDALLPYCHAVFGDYGADDAAIAAALTGHVTPEGRLPFQLSASMEAVLARPCDQPEGDPSPRFALHFRAS